MLRALTAEKRLDQRKTLCCCAAGKATIRVRCGMDQGWHLQFTDKTILHALPSRTLIVGSMPIVSNAVSLVVVSVMLANATADAMTQAGFVVSGRIAMLFFVGRSLLDLSICLCAALGLIPAASFAAVPELNTTD